MKKDELDQLFLKFQAAGDRHALAQLFDVAAPQLLPVAAHLAARRDEADDLIHATFLTAIERADSYERGRPVLSTSFHCAPTSALCAVSIPKAARSLPMSMSSGGPESVARS